MLERAVSAGGTGLLARVPGYRVAGKTGTAQKVDPVAGGYSSDRFVAVFAGFLPAQDPRVVIVVAVDEPQTAHSGGTVAAPIFAEIGEAAMRYLGVVPSERLTRSESPPAVADEPGVALAPAAGDSWAPAPDRVPSYLGLTARQVLARYSDSRMAFDLELQGSGRVVRQSPKPGAERRSVRRVTLVLAGP
jgi:cell division protein FtsI (penicillin-binding protein 3)